MPDVFWHDAALKSFEFDFGGVTFFIVEPTGEWVKVRANGQIGLEVIGYWPESEHIFRAEIVQDHPFAARCWTAIQEHYRGTGTPRPPELGYNAARDEQTWQTLVLTMDDAPQVICAAHDFDVLRVDVDAWGTVLRGGSQQRVPLVAAVPDGKAIDLLNLGGLPQLGTRVRHRTWWGLEFGEGTVVSIGAYKRVPSVAVHFDNGDQKLFAVGPQ
jgi:hypothetical protein